MQDEAICRSAEGAYLCSPRTRAMRASRFSTVRVMQMNQCGRGGGVHASLADSDGHRGRAGVYGLIAYVGRAPARTG